MLSVKDLATTYGAITALTDVTFTVNEGELVSVIGSNGAGKTTLLYTISGVLAPSAGTIEFCGRRIAGLSPESIAETGIALVPEGRRIFSSLSVEDNLALGAVGATRRDMRVSLEKVFELFPILKDYRRTLGGRLSGGEQQQLAIGRALMSQPRLLMLDEPSLGLAPQVISSVFGVLRELQDRGATILLVEQNALRATALATRTHVLQTGRIALSGTREELLRVADEIVGSYLGRSVEPDVMAEE